MKFLGITPIGPDTRTRLCAFGAESSTLGPPRPSRAISSLRSHRAAAVLEEADEGAADGVTDNSYSRASRWRRSSGGFQKSVSAEIQTVNHMEKM